MSSPTARRSWACTATVVLAALLAPLAACTSDGSDRKASDAAADAASDALERALDDAEQRTDEGENPSERDGDDRAQPTLFTDPAPALAAFRAEVGEAPRASEVFLYAGDYAIGVFQDPAQPENLDRYVYRDGVVEAPEPVRVSQADIDAYPDILFELSSVNFAAVPQLVDAALTRLGPEIEGAQVSAIAVYRIGSVDPARPTFVVMVNGPRRNGVLRATADGVVIDATVS